ncbi:MAG: hypothetical protein FWF59_04235 [Turicibacter sp.]|nr:hypothetical protein [Turicibacter sp.]
MLKFFMYLSMIFVLGACSQQVEPKDQVLVTTTVLPEVTVTIQNNSSYTITVLATSSIGATTSVDGNSVVTRLPFEEVVIGPGEDYIISWDEVEGAIAIAGNVDVLIDGEIHRLNATF